MAFMSRKKSSFDLAHQTWKYAIRGKTTDGIGTRIIVALVEKMVITTVIKLIKRKLRRKL